MSPDRPLGAPRVALMPISGRQAVGKLRATRQNPLGGSPVINVAAKLIQFSPLRQACRRSLRSPAAATIQSAGLGRLARMRPSRERGELGKGLN